MDDTFWNSISREMNDALHRLVDNDILIGFRDAQSNPIPAQKAEKPVVKAVKIVKARKVTGGETVKKPKCPTHEEDMVFSPELGRWRCPATECMTMAKKRDVPEDEPPKQSKPDLMPAKSPSLNVVANNKITLTIRETFDGNESYWIGWSDGLNELVIDVSDNVETVIDDQTNSVSLVLLFNEVRRV